jgi:putative copper export protein
MARPYPPRCWGTFVLKALWLVVITLFVVSVSGLVPASIGSIFVASAILIAMVLLAIAERRRLAARLSPGEKLGMPKSQKIILAVFAVLILLLVFIGRLTKQ